MSNDEAANSSFKHALEVVRRGQFDEIKEMLESLGFQFRSGTDPNHWTYFHPRLREDPFYRFPRHLYRPHGERRSSDRVTRLDQTGARQLIKALEAATIAKEIEGENDE